MKYPHSTLWMNGRLVSLDSIIQDTAETFSAFESNTFSFIREWLSGNQTFTLQTSGSTGEPKLIKVTREQMEASAKLSAQALQLKRSMQALICIDTRYIGGKMMIVRCLETGMCIHAVDPSGNPLVKIPIDQCVNFAAFVPLQIQNILGSKHPHSLNNLDEVIIGGAPLDEKVIQQLNSFLCRCYATYGMTETLSHIALRLLNGRDKQPHFELLPGVSIQKDERSCLVIRLPYLKEPVVTNDLVELTGPRQFVWLGRWDNVINSGGVKVIPEKVEAAIEKNFLTVGITDRFFVHGIKDETLGQKVVLYLEGTSYKEEALRKILNDLTGVLPPFEIPREIYIVPTFATTDTGKVNRIKTTQNLVASTRIIKK